MMRKNIWSWAPFTLYRITSERSDLHTRFGCCLHYTTLIHYAPRSENLSALEVIQKVTRYVPEQCEASFPLQSYRSETYLISLFYFFVLNTLLDKYIPRGRSANGTRGPMRSTPPIRHITHRTYKRK